MAVYGNTVSDKIDILENYLLEYNQFFESIDYSSLLNEGASDKTKVIIDKIKEYWKKFVAWFKEKVAKLKNIVVKKVSKVSGLSKINFSRKFETPNVTNKSLMKTINDAIDQIKDFCGWIASSRIDRDNIHNYKEYMYRIRYNSELGKFGYVCTEKQEFKGNYDKLYDEYSKLNTVFENGIKEHNDVLTEINKLIPKIDALINKGAQRRKDNIEKMHDSDSIENSFTENRILFLIEYCLKDSIAVMEKISSVSSSIVAAYKKAQIYNGKAIIYREKMKDDEENK